MADLVTIEDIEKAIVAERDFTKGQFAILQERLNGIDRATVVLSDTINRTPTEIQKAIHNMRELTHEKFSSIDKQVEERDVRAEREARDNKVAVEAAFAAQKEAIGKLEVLFTTRTNALGDRVDDLKTRFERTEGTGIGLSKGWGILVSGVGFIILILGFLATR